MAADNPTIARNRRNLTGLQVGHLTVLEDVGGDEQGHRIWLCRCNACGGEYRARAGYLLKVQRRGAQASCGCRRSAATSTHGLSKHPAYDAWCRMHKRCYKPEYENFRHYGGRGIKVCKRWHAFELFWIDFGHSWSPGLSVDRIDVNGDYEPGNVRWANQKVQCNNRRNNRFLDTPAGRMTLSQAAEHYGIDITTLAQRLDNMKWPLVEALTRPKRSSRKAAT